MKARQSTDETSPFYLSQQDVERLLHDDSPDSRIDVLEKVSDHYNRGAFQEREMEIAEQIFRLLVKDSQERVRFALAQHVKDSLTIPRDIVLDLVQDVEAIAVPIIQSSQVLSDADLMNIIEHSREVSRILAITQRRNVSARVSTALIGTHYPDVVKGLLDNQGATINPAGYQQIIQEFAAETAVIEALSVRPNLPLTVVEKVIHHVSDHLAAELQRRYKISPQDLEKNMQQSREDATLLLVQRDVDPFELDRLVGQMVLAGRLSPSMILSSLCRGNLRFFETALSKLANIPVPNARKLINDRGPLGFPALYEKTGLPPSMFEAVRLLLQVVREIEDRAEPIIPGSAIYANRVVEKLLQAAEGRVVENLSYMIALIRQNATG